MKGLPEERAIRLAQYIIEQEATVRQAAAQFGISKSTVHMDDGKRNHLKCHVLRYGQCDRIKD